MSVMHWELLIRLAGCGLLLIVVANAIVPGMLGYGRNLARCERLFGQVFVAHAVYLVVVILAMALLCLWRPGFFLHDEVGRAAAFFFGLFWGSRFVVQLLYYDREVKSRYPLWNFVFLAGFFALGAGFLTVAMLP